MSVIRTKSPDVRLLCVILLSAFLVALASGMILTENYGCCMGYGFPLPWKVNLICGSGSLECAYGIYTTYDWAPFAFDVLFYVGSAYGLLMVLKRRGSRKGSDSFGRLSVDVDSSRYKKGGGYPLIDDKKKRVALERG